MDVVGIIIPSHNRKNVTLQCIKDLMSVEQDGFTKKIYLVDDASTDGTASEVQKRYGHNVEIIRGDGNLFWTGAINLGITRAVHDKCDYLLLLNDDVTFENDFLLQLYKTIKNRKKTVVGSITYDVNDKNRILISGRILIRDFRRPMINVDLESLDKDQKKSAYVVDVVSGFSVIMPSDIIADIGYLDQDRFPHASGDHEFFFRVKKFGYEVMINPKSVVYAESDLKLLKVLSNKSKLRGIYDLWFDKRYFGIQTCYRLTSYFKANRLLCLGYEILSRLRWSILRLVCCDKKLKNILGTSQ